MPDKVAKKLDKDVKVRRIKFRADDNVCEYWKFWKGGSVNLKNWGSSINDTRQQVSICLKKVVDPKED